MIFVVDEHRAKRAGLHHDLRLQVNGEMESWAIPKGIPTSPGIRRLAIRTHRVSVDMADFEGEIEEGYGAGTIDIFDEGEYTPIDWGDDFRYVNLRGEKGRVVGNYYIRRWEGGKWLIWKR